MLVAYAGAASREARRRGTRTPTKYGCSQLSNRPSLCACSPRSGSARVAACAASTAFRLLQRRTLGGRSVHDRLSLPDGATTKPRPGSVTRCFGTPLRAQSRRRFGLVPVARLSCELARDSDLHNHREIADDGDDPFGTGLHRRSFVPRNVKEPARMAANSLVLGGAELHDLGAGCVGALADERDRSRQRQPVGCPVNSVVRPTESDLVFGDPFLGQRAGQRVSRIERFASLSRAVC
jgi:hypothetical protein